MPERFLTSDYHTFTLLFIIISIPHVRKWDEVKDDEGNYIIPFVIRGFYVDDEKKLIRDAMDDIGANTCIRFRERRDEETYVEIINKEGEGCSSSLGRLPSGNRLQLEASRIGNCVTKKIVFHELMHIIGMDHEHKRQDRDKYVKIHWENIEEGMWLKVRCTGVRANEATLGM
ncbi:hypothetical protein Y032_0053g2400 [Ancylostoma ceylanicum]|nr:hypothetical protein Y032_0053g2400 [Ancylostoma ceylanicum]